ncbi:MAG TPA: cytochrome c biogenesis protein CcsA [Edaphocola sp.]|nr:cytochrome c biogenesis protein CcsA [Edaphocola sp.]
MRKLWWKLLAVILIIATIIIGLLIPVPALNILNETIRNLFFHVPMWFGMMFFFGVSLFHAIKYLGNQNIKSDIKSEQYAKVGILYGSLGMITGMEWAQFTWGDYWSNDPKQLAAAISLLIYFAYLVLRSSIPDYDKKAKVAAVFNAFSFFIMIPLVIILPRLTESLHPGNGGNPAFGELAPALRPMFYISVVAWILLGTWIATLGIRLKMITLKDIIVVHKQPMDIFLTENGKSL